EPALAAIADGVSADRAWSAALDREIADFATTDDHHFRARAADLVDLRDRVLAHLSGTAPAASPTPPAAVLVAADLTPPRFLATDWTHGGAIALGAGSASSHVAVLARARGVPMVVGLGPVPAACREALVDGTQGVVAFDPSATLRAEFAARAAAAEAATA